MTLRPNRLLALATFVLLSNAAAAQVSPPVLLPGDTTLAVAAGEQEAPEIARGASGYLAVWQDARTSLTYAVQSDGSLYNTDIYATLLDDDGQVVGNPIVVNQDSFSQHRPHVAWNGTNYLVVWETTRLSGVWKTDGIYAARVTPTGVVLDDPPIVVDDSDDQDEHYPLVASDGVNWMVLWTDYDGGPTEFVEGAVVSPNGFVTAKQPVVVPAGQAVVPRNYDLVYGVDRYFFVYENGWGGATRGHFIDGALGTIGGQVQVSTPFTGFRPGVGASDTGFYVTWTTDGAQSTSEVRGTPVSTSGVVAVPGGATLGPGVWTSSADPTVAWNGFEWTAIWNSFSFTSGNSLSGAQVSPSGAVLPGSPYPIIPSTGIVTAPASENGSGHAVFLWNDGRNSPQFGLERDVYGMKIGVGGLLFPDHPVNMSAPSQTHAAIAGDRQTGYLVVFQSETAGVRRVVAQRLDGLGNAIDPQPIVVTTGGSMLHGHDVAWNGSEWLIVWEERQDASSSLFPSRIFARRMLPDGTLLDGAPIDVLPGNFPAVGALGGDFLVATSEEPQDHIRFIRTQRVRGSDGALVGSMTTVSGNYSLSPDVVGLADRWLVAWHRRPTHDSPFAEIQGNSVLAGGGIGTVFSMESATGNTHTGPALAAGDTVAMVVWTDDAGDIRARRIGLDAAPLDSPSGIVVCNVAGAQFWPAIGWDGEGFLTAFHDYRLQTGIEPGVGDVFASRIEKTGALLDFPLGIPLGAHFQHVEANPAVAGGGGFTVTAHSALHPEAPFATNRIVLRTLDRDGVGDRFCFGDGFGAACPCGNEAEDGGCANGTGAGGKLSGTGSESVGTDDLAFHGADLAPQQPALLFQGTAALSGGIGTPFGDGLRCAGGTVTRLQVMNTSIAGTATWTQLASSGGWVPGQTLNFQVWHRNPVGSPCGALFNLTNALRVTFTP